MGLMNRPYIGTWKMEGRGLVAHTPDAVVYINGDTTIPGCPKCSGRINIQKFLTEVSVDAGTEPTSASASFTLSIPIHHNDSFARDARFILRPGLEVHVYMRGYFPVMGLYSNLAEPQLAPDVVIQPSGQMLPRVTAAPVPPVERNYNAAPPKMKEGAEGYTREQIQDWAERIGVTEDVLITAFVLRSESGVPQERTDIAHTIFNRVDHPNDKVYGKDAWSAATGSAGTTGKQGARPYSSVVTPSAKDLQTLVPLIDDALEDRRGASTLDGATHFFHPTTQDALWKEGRTERSAAQVQEDWTRSGLVEVDTGIDRARFRAFKPAGWVPDADQVESTATAALGATAQATAFQAPEEAPLDGSSVINVPELATGPSLLAQQGLDNQGIENVVAHPYYHVFHGVTTDVTHSYSAGVASVSVACSSMLHFWQFQNMSTNASVFGARPTNSKLKMSMVGHNFTGMHPYQIMYSLHYDMVGAAGGVGWALSQKDNQAAVSEVGKESLFSLNIKYWERRFSTGMIKLRLHGANGELFSAMQAAWLGRTSSSNLTALLRSRYAGPAGHQNSMDVYNQSLALGMGNHRRMEALIQAKRSQPGGKDNTPKFEINLVEMQAFVSNIGNWGQIQLFESTYESKLDIANKVCEVTGFEFFQDVDGDFVFKPPFFNLDTADSRVYRIEDIDLINVSFSSKEPMVTYMTVKGQPFAVQGTGCENEWGVRGQYIDYRLVAQFGWRPGSYETAYFNDPKSMFFSAVNRMDVMNVGMNTASVTIPVRPELRPGYPVYIPYLDCYYYCNSFAHSHSQGGQCTTSLQLVGRRAKFFAPGRVDQTGIRSIDLANTTLPEKPLQVLDNEGHPRLAGFPNVVMALDPTEVNPLFFVVGLDTERINDPHLIGWLLDVGVKERLIYFSRSYPVVMPDSAAWVADKVQTPAEGMMTKVGPGYYVMKDAKNEWVTFYFDAEGAQDAAQRPAGLGVDLMKEAQLYANELETFSTTLDARQKDAQVQQQKLDSLQFQLQSQTSQYMSTPPSKEAERKKLGDEIEKTKATIRTEEVAQQALASQLAQEERQFEDDLKEGKRGSGISLLLYLINKMGERYRTSRAGSFGDLNSSINLLDMLSDKKATFSNGTQPGSYRYYSCSHPDPAQQGQAGVTYSKTEVTGEGGATLETTGAPAITVDNDLVDTFTDQAVNAPWPGAKAPEAQLVKRLPTNGIKVLNSNPGAPGGEVLPTSQIQELMFALQNVNFVKREWHTTKKKAGGLSTLADAKLAEMLQPMGEIPATSSFAQLYQPRWEEITSKSQTTALQGVSYDLGPDANPPPFPAKVKNVKGKGIDLSWNIEQINYSGCKGTDIKVHYGQPLAKSAFITALSGALGVTLAQELKKWQSRVEQAIRKSGGAALAVDAGKRIFSWLPSTVGSNVTLTEKVLAPKQVSKKEQTYSPVFPVSDAKGYEVVGSYRYGRGLDVDAGGVFSQIAAQDPFSLLDKYTIEKVLQLIVQKKRPVTVKKTEKGKTTVTTPVEETAEINSISGINDAVLKDLRKAGLTDRQILDYRGLLTSTENPNILQMNAANWFATGQEGPLKTPLINAAFALGDLSPITDMQVCECKASEANLMLEAFGTTEFLTLGGSDSEAAMGEGAGDQVTAWLRDQTTLAAGPWKVQQDALRGQQLDKGQDNLFKTVSRLGDQFDAARDQTLLAERRVTDAQGQVAESWDSFMNRKKREGT